MAERTRADRFLRWRGGWAKARPWRGHGDIAYLALSSGGVDAEIPGRCVDSLRERGYRSVVTGALAPADALPFLDSGFTVRERLDLLAHDMRSIPRPSRRTRRLRRSDTAAVLFVDRLAFDEEWRLDAAGFDDAIDATPSARVRVAEEHDSIIGYSVTGRAGRRGYLQRVAVHPSAQRNGWGLELVADALCWLERRGVARTMVNTQMGNDPARQLYLACGFEVLPVGLCVLERDL